MLGLESAQLGDWGLERDSEWVGCANRCSNDNLDRVGARAHGTVGASTETPLAPLRETDAARHQIDVEPATSS